MNPERAGFRFTVLFFNCLLTFGSYFCFDMPSVLETKMEANRSLDPNSTDYCTDCLQMTDFQYNLLYSIYAWTNAVIVIFAGFLVDKLGNRFGVFLFSTLCVIGSSIFALGAMFPGTKYMLPLMLLGRLIFGSGNGSLTVVQNRITGFWFKDKELAMAFGCTLAFSRLGSVLNFFLTANLAEKITLQGTLWLGAGLCVMGFISAVIVGVLDVYGVRKLGLDSSIQQASKAVKVSDLAKFNLQFWLIVFTIMFYYNGVFPFVADASTFIQDKYGYKPTTSAYIAGAVYDVSLALSPFLGGLIDIIGKRGYLTAACALLTVPVYGLLAFTYVHPLVLTLWLGITYTFAAATMWPSIPLVVTQATLGTAMGITTSIQMIGIGICNTVVGKISGHGIDGITNEEKLTRWKYVMLFLLVNAIACIITSVIGIVVDKRRDSVLNQSKAEAAERAAANRSLTTEVEPPEEPNERTPILGNRDRSIQ